MPRLFYTALPLAFLLSACSPEAKTPVMTPAEAADTIKHAYALIGTNQPEEAIHLFDKVIDASPDNVSAYNGKGVAFDHAGNHLAAQELYQRALGLAPDSLSIRNNLAMSLILNGQLDEAIALLEELNQQHDSKTVRQNLAMAYGLKGDVSRALELNLKDLPPTEAQENMKFYKSYATRLKKLKPSDLPTHAQIGFAPALASEDKISEKTPIKTSGTVSGKTEEKGPQPLANEPAEKIPENAEPAASQPDTVMPPHSESPKDTLPPAPAADEPTLDDNSAASSSFPAQRHSITY